MKKSYAAWAVLLIIALVASFLLGLTNEVTKDKIAQQQTAQAEKARQDLQPEADTFEALELAEGSGLSGLYEARKAGERIGLVATVLTQGFGGEVEVTAGFTNEAALTGISVGGASFAETPGLGAKAKDAAFTEQFKGKTPRLKLIKADGEKGDNTVDAITAATRTSNAVTNAVNTAGEYVKSVLGISDEEETVAIGSRSAKASAQGFGGLVAVDITLDDQDRISEITIGDDEFAETEGIGARALEPEVAQAFIGLTPPLSVGDVDVLTGATVTKTALVDAVNKAAQMIRDAAGTPSVKVSEQGFGGLVAVTLTMDEYGKIAGLTIGDDEFAETEGIGARALEPEVAQAFIGLTPPLSVGDVDVLTGATVTKTAIVNAINKGAAKLANAAAGAAEAPAASAEEPAAPAEEPAAPAEEPAAPTEAPASEPAADTAPAAAETKASAEAPAADPASALAATGKGFGGPVTVYVTFTAEGKVETLSVSNFNFSETAGFGARALDQAELAGFIGLQAPLTVEGVDALAGASITKTSIVNAINAAYASAFGLPEATAAVPAEETAAPAEEPASEPAADTVPAAAETKASAEAPAADPASALAATGKGFGGPVTVYVTFTAEGKVETLSVSNFNFSETAGFGARALDQAELAGFIGLQAPLTVEGVDALAGASITKTAVVNAINAAYASAFGLPKAPAAVPAEETAVPAEEPASEPAADTAPAAAETKASAEAPAADPASALAATGKGFGGPVTVYVTFTAEGKVETLSVSDFNFSETAGFGARALDQAELAGFIGLQAPLTAEGVDALAGASITKTAVVNAINAAWALAQ